MAALGSQLARAGAGTDEDRDKKADAGLSPLPRQGREITGGFCPPFSPLCRKPPCPASGQTAQEAFSFTFGRADPNYLGSYATPHNLMQRPKPPWGSSCCCRPSPFCRQGKPSRCFPGEAALDPPATASSLNPGMPCELFSVKQGCGEPGAARPGTNVTPAASRVAGTSKDRHVAQRPRLQPRPIADATGHGHRPVPGSLFPVCGAAPRSAALPVPARPSSAAPCHRVGFSISRGKNFPISSVRRPQPAKRGHLLCRWSS